MKKLLTLVYIIVSLSLVGKERPNIVFIFSDDHATQAISAYGGILADVAPSPKDMQGASLVPVLKNKKPENWRKSHYYHYYEFPGWHMVQRHEGVYDGRYKLMYFYDIDEWELYDLEKDPKELQSQYDNPEYAKEVKRLKKELTSLRKKYKVPANEPKDVSNPDQTYVTNHVPEVIK